ncbi:MAG: AarF/UbiB family protein [Myxococcota bacterium]
MLQASSGSGIGTMAGEGSERGAKGLPGRFRRSLTTAKLAGSVSSRLIGGKIADVLRRDERAKTAREERALENARRVVSTMTELRGPMMKIGQLLSTHAKALPKEVAHVLMPLQQQAPPMAWSTIRRVLIDDLGETPETLFAEIGEDAVAAASLGQVHRATLPDGTEVAVKIQYPGAEASVEGDMRNLELGAAVAKRLIADTIGNQRLDATPIAEEIAEHIRQETDYCREAYNAKLLGKLFRDDPHVVVPRVHDSHSGLRVITYDWLEGEELDWGLRNDDPTIRERTVRQLTHAFWFQMFKGGVLHADPHPGNYRILADGRLGLLDYGCVKVFGESFLEGFSDMVLARIDQDEERLLKCLVALELIDDPEDQQQIDDMAKIADYCSTGLHADEPFDFSEFSYVEGAQELVRHFLARRQLPPAQKDFLFLTRVVLGYYEYFSRAEAHLNFRQMVEPYIRPGYEGRTIEVLPYD